MKNYLLIARSAVLVFLTHKIALPLLKILRRPNPFTFSKAELMHLPAGTLGNDLFLFLEKRNLPLLKHYARHDVKHVLLNYDTTDEGEICLQSFMLGNGRFSFPVVATVLFGMMTMPEHWKNMQSAYRKGKTCQSFHHWQWNKLMLDQTKDLRNKIFYNYNN